MLVLEEPKFALLPCYVPMKFYLGNVSKRSDNNNILRAWLINPNIFTLY
jgi:hypothetical protein